MRNRFNYVALVMIIIMLFLISCNSTKSDAKKAALLINKSIEQTHALKLEDAEKTYLKAQEIIDKYREKDRNEEFFEYFAVFRDKERKQNAK